MFHDLHDKITAVFKEQSNSSNAIISGNAENKKKEDINKKKK